ncbi:MAG: chromate transporter [Firmicutes bacterium]|jgi:chromate transporter|nr:chromate transporter [Bacillota bacterium]
MPIWAELFASFFKIGLFTFGGGYAMIPLIQREIIEAHGWLTMEQFVDMVAIAEITPGPIAVNCATLVGFRLAGFWGSALATLGVVSPSSIVVTLLAAVLGRTRNVPRLETFFRGVRPAVVSMIAYAGYSVARSALTDARSVAIMVTALVLLTRARVHPILLLVLAGVAGALVF